MNIEEQIKSIRHEKHLKYLKYVSEEEAKINNTINKEKKIKILGELYNKYYSPKTRAAIKIQKFIKKYYFEPICLNDEKINGIPVMYRFKIFITNHHVQEYHENGIDPEELKMHRLIYKIIRPVEKIVYFRYCFDIRNLYPHRNEILELYDNFYFLQPDDHLKINNLWKKINGESNESIMYLNNFEYNKSLSIDMYKNYTDDENIKILDNIKIFLEELELEPVSDSFNEKDLDREYLDQLNREYINCNDL